ATCVGLAAARGRRAIAAVTDMSQPLGEAVGNALDVAECVGVLAGRNRGRLRELAVLFAGRAANALTGTDPADARDRAETALDDGSALERFARMVEAQGGDPRVADEPWSVLPRAPVIADLPAPATGILAAVDAEAVGRAAVVLGAGRVRKGDPVDPAVGLVFRPKVGDRLIVGDPIGQVHARAREAA